MKTRLVQMIPFVANNSRLLPALIIYTVFFFILSVSGIWEVVSNLPLCFLLQTLYFHGLHHFFIRKSNDLPFLCKYYYQPTNTERKIIA